MESADKLTGRRVLVLGLGASGAAAARLTRRLGASVTAVDSQSTEAAALRAAELTREGIDARLGQTELPPGSFDLAVTSPGLPVDAPWLRELGERGVLPIPELELGWRYCSARVLAVTGSNGKSTLVKLCAEALTTAGLRAVPCGNYGAPLSEIALAEPAPDWTVVEASSFQLEIVERFRPDVGVLFNLTPNHLDRHGDFAAYRRAKLKLFARMTNNDTAVIGDDLAADALAELSSAPRRVSFGAGPDAAWRWTPGALRGPGGACVACAGTPFDNEILGLTAAAACAAVAACGVAPEAVGAALCVFKSLPHRMQTVGEARGVRFVDNSKATTLAALAAAVRMAGGPVRLIAGGMLKETDLTGVKKVLSKGVRAVYTIGKSSYALADAWSDAVPCVVCGDLRCAVDRAWKEAEAGEVILLAPGGASFDQFRGFDDRGNQFSEMVQLLIVRGERQ